MDVTTLRIAFAVLAGVLILLFYAAAYRPTRSPFSGWWTFALVLSWASALAFLGDGTRGQVLLNPLGNGLGVASAQASWCAARSLHARPPQWRWLVVAPLTAMLAGIIDDPAHNTWAGGLTFLLLMAGAFAAASLEMRAGAGSLAKRATGRRATDNQGLRLLCGALAFSSGGLSLYYAMRAVAYQWAGPFSRSFVTYFGTGPTTLLLIVQLATVSFSMSSLSTLQQIVDLRNRAVYDQLTGLMRPQEFRRYAGEALPHLARGGEIAVAAVVDFDHFKKINDELGHPAGDDVLRAFGDATLATIGKSGVCGRLGGDEFGLLFTAPSLEDAEGQLAAIVRQFERSLALADNRRPTVSVGIAAARNDSTITSLLDRADQALYRAKTSGRDCTARG